MVRKLLNLGGIKIPVEAATKSEAFLGKRGSGKTYNAAVFAEELYRCGIPILVFDPIDVWWGLKVDKDGKGKGLDIPVFGIEHSDIPLTKDMGPEIVEAIIDNNASAIISTFGMPKVQQRHLITQIAEELLIRNDTPRHVFIEEAHWFVPQRIMADMTKVFHAVSALVIMGRNRGIGVGLINQRAATINKDVLTQIDTLFALRNVAPQDRKALREWVEHYSAEDKFDEFMDSLPGLKTGDAWVWSPEFLDVFKKIRIRERRTFHPDREKLGTKFIMPDMDKFDFSGFVAKFKGNIAKKRDEKRSDKEKVRELTLKVRELEKTVPTVTQDDIDAAVAPIKTDFERQMAESNKKMMEGVRKFADALMPKVKKIADAFNTFYHTVKPMLDELDEIEALGIEIPEFELQTQVQRRIVQNVVNRHQKPEPTPNLLNVYPSSDFKLGGASLKILEVLVQRAPLKFTKSQISLTSGYSIKSSTFANAISTLNRNGLIDKDNGQFSPTQKGLDYFGVDVPQPQTIPERLEMWKSKLGEGFAGKLFNLLVSRPSQLFSKDDIEGELGYSQTSSTFANGISTLNRNGLLQKEGGFLKAAEELFL